MELLSIVFPQVYLEYKNTSICLDIERERGDTFRYAAF